MREIIIARILALRDDGAYSAWRLFKKPNDDKSRKKILADGYYPTDMDFNTLSDKELVEAFERIARQSGKQYG